ncbi:FAD-binding oxidoreductase [bacterium]|nr:FAD-binding oxidoreductase [bacterium]
MGVLYQLPLARDHCSQVVVVGGGMAGMSVAYFLALEGVEVAVLDDGPIGGGMTGLSTAHLSYALEGGYARLEAEFGPELTRQVSESHRAAVAIIEEITFKESLDCQFLRVDGYLFNPPGQPYTNLEFELRAARRAGLEVEWMGRAPLTGLDSGPCLRFRDQGQFHPLRYLAGLTRAFLRLGGKVYTGTQVARARGGAAPRVETVDGFRIDCDRLVLATNSGPQGLTSSTYVVALRLPRGSVPVALYWDTLPCYHYLRVVPDGATDGSDLLVAGGEDQVEDACSPIHFAKLEKWVRERFPQAREVDYLWSGKVINGRHQAALIGAAREENTFIVSGGGGHGLTHGIIAGQLIGDLVQGRPNQWAHLYAPHRPLATV